MMASNNPDSNAKKFAAANRDLDWQRASFLTYCLSVAGSNPADNTPEEIIVRKILGGYLTLALLFYKQFREDLFKHYPHAADDPDSVDDSGVKQMSQSALDKLVQEWHRIYAIIAAIRARRSNDVSKQIVDQMSSVVGVAMRDVGLSPEEFPIVLQFGQPYSMRFSNYSDTIAALNIPLWVMDSPWEWTILWHELAGEKVRQLKIENTAFFETLFNDVMEPLGEAKAEALANGWSLNWLEELFEDAFSIIHFPIHFLYVLKNLLERVPDGGIGERHPPTSIRLATTMFLHLQMKQNFTEPPVIAQWPSWTAWPELNDETTPDRFKAYAPEGLLSNALDLQVAWLAAKKTLEWHQRNHIDTTSENAFRTAISQAIIDYARKDDYEEIRQSIVEVVASLPNAGIPPPNSTDDAYSLISEVVKGKLLTKLPEEQIDKLRSAHPQVGSLLNGLGYKQLLDLRFSDIDYHNINDIRFWMDGQEYWVNPTTWQNQPQGRFKNWDGRTALGAGMIGIAMFIPLPAPGNWQRLQVNRVDWNNLSKTIS